MHNGCTIILNDEHFFRSLNHKFPFGTPYICVESKKNKGLLGLNVV